jgi:hypothetical protein
MFVRDEEEDEEIKPLKLECSGFLCLELGRLDASLSRIYGNNSHRCDPDRHCEMLIKLTWHH